jgi:uncharacterized protein (TIGR03086 family)
MTGFRDEGAGMTTATDPRPIFAAALRTATDTIASVPPGRLGDPTPCTELDVRGLLGHMVNVLQRATAIGRKENPFEVPRLETLPGDEWLAAWNDAVAEYEEVWSDDSVLDVPSPLPWAQGDGRVVIGGYVNEITIHTWDLATALGVTPAWDQAVLEHVAAGVGQGMPATNRTEVFAPIKAQLPPHLAALPDPFLDAVPVPDDAPLIDKIVAWSGRNPR